eukprot:4439895-Pleurochrysis_carterae.AAC.1
MPNAKHARCRQARVVLPITPPFRRPTFLTRAPIARRSPDSPIPIGRRVTRLPATYSCTDEPPSHGAARSSLLWRSRP